MNANLTLTLFQNILLLVKNHLGIEYSPQEKIIIEF